MTYNIGDAVKWTSQSRGRSTTKRGVIVAIVPEGQRPDRGDFPDLYRGVGCGYPRQHDSFVVRVGNKHYWPRVTHLSFPQPTTE